jgi:L-amino acid N-acyltransferase YncA
MLKSSAFDSTGKKLEDIGIRPARESDLDAIWDIFHFHLAAGETYSFEAHTPKSVCEQYWLGQEVTCFVAVDKAGCVLGMYRLVPNQPGRGAHVANASYMVSDAAQGKGVGYLMGKHSLDEARRLGYLAMQFNYVVSTNQPAVALWQKLGFSIVGRLPKAYRHQRLGFVDALVMYQLLSDPDSWPGRAA